MNKNIRAIGLGFALFGLAIGFMLTMPDTGEAGPACCVISACNSPCSGQDALGHWVGDMCVQDFTDDCDVLGYCQCPD